MSDRLRAIIYARSSGDDPQFRSLDEQHLRGHEYAQAQGYQVICTLFEVGGSLADGPQLRDLYERAECDEVDIVIVSTPDRLAPDPERRAQIAARLAMWGVRVQAIEGRVLAETR